MIKRLLTSETCARGFFHSSVFSLVSKSVAFLTSIAIAFYFGADSSTDLYFYSFSVITMASLFLTSINSTILIPHAMRVRENQSNSEATKFLNVFLYSLFLIALCISIVILVKPFFFFSVVSNFEHEIIENNIIIIRLCAAFLPLLAVNQFMSETLISYRIFTIPVFLAFVNNIFSLTSVLLFHNRFGILSIVLGSVFAHILQFLTYVIIIRKKFNWQLKFEFKNLNRKIFSDICLAQIGNASSMLMAYFPLYLLSNFSVGIISSLNYGLKISETVTTLLTVQLASITGIKLNELYARNNTGQVNDSFYRSAQIILFVLVPFAFFLSAYSKDIVILLFNRGAFDLNASITASSFLRVFALSIPLTGLNAIIARLFMAAQKVNYSVFFQIFTSILMIVAIYFGVNLLGPAGYPIAYVGVYFINILSVHFMIKKFIPEIDYKRVLLVLFKTVLFNIPPLLLIFLINEISHKWPLVNIVAGAIVYFSTLLVLNFFLKINHDINFYIAQKFIPLIKGLVSNSG
ncbi:putative peptidoglycan lipid II flippase MurJ [Chitinispirillum alkaliphilum]|nr:putative peptidoglycan lipid II flippase MurJ [Chitinispirillum alkaliphilum]